jgi:hypothetical protein
MSIEAMKQALDALEIGYESVKHEADQWRFFDCRQLNLNRLELLSTAIETDVKKITDAITTLRAAIQQAEETHWKLSCGCPSQYGGIPAEWATTDREGSLAIAYGVICEKHWHEYDAQHPKVWQGPVAWMYTNARGRTVIVKTNTSPFEDAIPLYTAPPQREWQGLTEEEIIIMSRYNLEYAALIGEVQGKLKEKNT